MAENSATIMAGGLEMNVTGNNIQFTIGDNKWIMSVGQVEAMLASHQLLKDSCKQILSCMLVPPAKVGPREISIIDKQEMLNGILSADIALRIAE